MTLQDVASASAMLKQELAPLAEKIGQGAEYTFGLFIKQVYVNAIMHCFWIPVGIGSLITSLWFFKKEKVWANTSNAGGGIFGGIAFLLLALPLILLPLAYLVPAIINPEYQAIQLIIETFKTK